MIRSLMVGLFMLVTTAAATAPSRVALQQCGIVGDSIASGVSNYAPLNTCQKNVAPGTNAAQIAVMAKTINPSRNIIISAGSNDQATPISSLDRSLTTIRRSFRTSTNVIWILPIVAGPRAAVVKVAAKNRDKTVSFVAGPDGVHPLDEAKLAADIQALMI